jgi:hypothetical protein
MTISNPHSLFDEDKCLKTGTLVNVFWSRSGFNYRCRGRIVKLQRSSATVALSERIGYGEGYPAGSQVTVPRILDAARWSSHNCVRLPVGGKSSGKVKRAG